MSSITTPSAENSATRLEFWRDIVSRNFVPLEIVPREGPDLPDFHAQLSIARIGEVRVSVVTTPAHTARTRRSAGADASDHVKVSLQLTGHCVLTQGDHQAELKPGELAVYDTRRPYTLDTDRPGRSLALMFLRAMLRLPERELARVTATSVSCRDGLGTVVRPFLYGLARQVDELESLGTPRLAENVADLLGTLLAERTGADRTSGHEEGHLFIPKAYDRDHHKSYPLVLFMHDASVVNVATEGPLVQGLGAVCWASPEDQARHEAFVLAPEYGAVVIDDDYEPSTLFDATANLVESVTQQYGIDRDRRYTTGQSMGAMMSLGLNIRYPDLFAAAFIVAGQWPEAQAVPLAEKNLWILVSADDTKAYPGEQAITEVIQEQGTKVSTALWDGQSTAAEFAADVRRMKAQRTPVNFAAFETGTTVPTGSTTSAHMGTWQIAYTIPGIRDWIMRQSL
jgi:predicted esterase